MGSFAYDIRWFPPEQPGSDAVTSYEAEIRRAVVTGGPGPDGIYRFDSFRELPVVTRTVHAKTATTNDLHTIEDIATFPLCELLLQGEDFAFAARVTARSAAGVSLPATCVSAPGRAESIVYRITQHRDYWSYQCNATGAGLANSPSGGSED